MIECYSCECEFDPEMVVIYTGCGQYVEYEAVRCPMCQLENKV